MIKLKGMHDSMIRCMIPEDAAEDALKAEFERIVAGGKNLLPGSRLVLDFGARALSEKLISQVMTDLIWPSGMSAAAWITLDAKSQDLMKRVGLPTVEPIPTVKSGAKDALAPSLMLSRTLRSGQRVEHPGDVIICGHVNDGAEIFASGSVTVLGRLRGLVHAGSGGRDSATIAARAMEAVQIRIGSKIGSMDKSASWWGKMVIAKIEDGGVLIDYWPTVRSERAEIPAQAVPKEG